MKAKVIKKSPPPPPPPALLRFTNKLPRLLSFLFIILTSLVLQTERPTQAATITVNSTCSLADAITAANTDTATGGCPAGSGADTITLTANITLGAALPAISSDITVDGTNSNFSIDGASTYRIFHVRSGNVTIKRLSLQNGFATVGGAIYVGGSVTISNSSFEDNGALNRGGAIEADSGSVVTVNNSAFSRNLSQGYGGAIYSGGQLTVNNSTFNANGFKLYQSRGTRLRHEGGAIYGVNIIVDGSTFSNNSTEYSAGAIYIFSGSVNNSTFSNNSSEDFAGAIFLGGGTGTIKNSSFTGHRVRDYGGAMLSTGGNWTVINSTFSGNSVWEGLGGAIAATGGSISLEHVTVSGNNNTSTYYPDGADTPQLVPYGAGIAQTQSGTINIRNSIIYGNGMGDCYGTLTTNSGNIIGTGTCGTPYSTANPLLGSWVSPADGSPGYFPLQAGSPAIDAVSCITGITTDIRGTSRPQGSNCDIGAYESDGGTVPSPAPTNLSVSGITTTSLTLNWDAVTGATNYKVFLDGTEQPLNVGGTSHSFTSLTPGTSYTLGVAAVGAGGTSATASIGASTSSTTSPPAPTNLSVSGITTTSLTLNWDAVTGATNYKVYLDGAEQPLNVGGTSHSFTSLTPGRSYTLGVAAVGAGGTSGTASISASTSSTTTPPTATDTPGGRVLFKLGSFEVTYSMIFGSGDPVGDYHPGFTEEGLSDLIDEMGILVGSGWRAASELGKYITAQYMCFSFSTIGEVLVDQGGIDLATNLLFDLNFWRVLGGIKGFLAGGKSGAVAGSTIPGIGTAAGGASVGAASAYLGPELAARMFTLVFSQALKDQKTRIVKSATSFLNSVLEEDDAKKKALELAFDVAGVGASIVVDIVADALFETLVKYLERAAISFKSGTNWWTPNRILYYASQEFPKQLLKAATNVNVYVKAAGLNIAEFGVTKWLESIVEDSVEWLTSTFIDCDSLEPVQKIRQNVNQFLTALGDGAEIIIEELGDDLRYWIWVIKDKINTLNKLIDQLRQMDSFNIQDIHGSICAVPEFKTMFPISVFCKPVVERPMVDAICLFGADMSDVTDDEGNTLRTLDCDELKNQYPEPVENFLVTSKYLTKWTCSKVRAVVPSSCAVAVGIQIFASPGQGWKEYIVRGNSLQLNSKHLPPSASGFQIRIRALNGSIASDPVLYPADPNDPTQFAAAPAIIIHENVPAPPAEDSDDRDDSGAAATSIPQAEPPASTCENLPPHLRVQHYHHSTQCNVLSRASVGHPDLVGNFIAGVDIWGYVGAVVEVCIQGSGPLRFVDTSEMPRSVRPLAAFSDGGLTCAWVERVGQVILVPGPPSPPKLKPATPGPATQALSNCMVTLEYVLNFRQGPGGPIRKTADGRDFWLPALVSLTALERTADWFYVDYHGERGWISADFVIERGDCQANAAPSLPTALPAWEPSPLPANPTAPAPDVTPVGMR